MNDVPLVNVNDINSINTSIIAIKKQLMQLNEAVRLIDTPNVNIDLTPFVKKTDVVDVVQSGNLNPVTSNAVATALSYSTSEQFTGAYWIDGKPIYKKTINFGSLPNNARKAVDHNVANIDKIIETKGYANERADFLPLPYSNVQISYVIQVWSTTTQVFAQTGINRTTYSAYITIFYTKTTDTATRSIPTENTRKVEEETKEEEPKEEEKK